MYAMPQDPLPATPAPELCDLPGAPSQSVERAPIAPEIELDDDAVNALIERYRGPSG
jgi:hypothetical protein